jgi:nucleoside-diphosphate-sugar epimerase
MEVERLIAELRVDASKARAVLGWSARVSFADEIQRMVDQYCKNGSDVSSGGVTR